jgi:receptor-binding and translocation channel-forming TcA subunit of Tc toxin
MKTVSMNDAGFNGLTAKKDYTRLSTTGKWETSFIYTFYNHFHPFVGELLGKLNKDSIEGLLDPTFHESPKLNQDFFEELYKPNTEAVGFGPFPKNEIDVSPHGAYAVYNWELLFHVPLTIAVHLSKNQRFAEAQRWFHYIFDPTTNDGQFWRFLAFRKMDVKQIHELLRIISKPEDELDDTERMEKDNILSGYETLRINPFQPHVVARTRPLAYQYCVVMKYLDNLIAWGDSLFRQDTIETLNEAMQVYVLAANLLGKKPEQIPQRGAIRPKTFAQLREKGMDRLGNALVELEGQFPFNLSFPTTNSAHTDKTSPLFGIGRTLYFCIPHNEKLLGYWDAVADRLFKIRHCMNIEGVVRQLPLFQPPIDPGMLVKAAAAGIDISRLVSGLNQPVAPVRSALLIQKALEICSEVRGLGGALLSALEKQDAEALGLMRQKHEITIQKLAQDVRYLQWKEAESATEALLKSRERLVESYWHYSRQLGGKKEDLKDITDFTLKRWELTKANFDEVYAELVEQYAVDLALDAYPDLEVHQEGKLFLNRNEDAELNLHMPAAKDYQLASFVLRQIAPSLALLPTITTNFHYWGIGGTLVLGGQALTENAKTAADVLDHLVSRENHQAITISKKASYERRGDEWVFQKNLAAYDLMHIGRQIISSLIREQIARHEYENLEKQIVQTQEIEQFLRDKFTNEELYGWMQSELSKLYYEYYKFAFDIARKAEQTMKHELMRPELDELNFIKFNYWDGGRKGLLSGEALHLDLKRMEMAYHDHNKREYELIKHVSLRQLDPVALLTLKGTGACEVTLSEWLFDLDTPGHYMRRIKNVSLSIPAVTGPYTNVTCTLSLHKSTLRRSPLLRDEKYARSTDEEDTRFLDYYGTIQSIVTSNAQNDSGLFETNLRDERFLPFEGHGVISTWRLELPAEFRQFDYNTISDVILHVRYTARQGGDQLRKESVKQLEVMVGEGNKAGLALLFSLKHDFPSEWHHFVSNTNDAKFSVKIKREYFPYLSQSMDIAIDAIQLHAIQDEALSSSSVDGLDLEDMAGKLNDKLMDERAFELTVPENDILKRNPQAQVFLLICYSLQGKN